MPPEMPDLSKTEWIVMNLCWQHGKATARQIYDEASEARSWEYQTVKTLMDRLVAKGYLRMEKLGPLCLFEPAIPQTKTVAKAIDGFMNTVLGNTVAPLFAHLAKGRKLSDDEIASLRKIIQENEKEKDK